LTALPVKAAVASTASAIGVLRAPVAHSAPVAKSSESPGRNGVTTKPVSANTMMNRMA
jgi:hypothetical protein